MALDRLALPHDGITRTADHLRPVRLWLYVVASMIVLMVVVGGATRLTESGLSITEWKPVAGTLPPLSEPAWQAEFEKYRQIPQYQQINRGMSLAEFKYIFWWEWGHRLLGRLIGFVFLLPFLFFLWRGLIDRPLGWKLAGLDAGLTYTTWPLMDGHLVPPVADLLVQKPVWRNFFENVLTVQFNHRLGAYVLLAFALGHWLSARRLRGAASRRALLILALVSAQASLGIMTLVHQVPIDIALAHQFGATLVLIAVTVHLVRLNKQA